MPDVFIGEAWNRDMPIRIEDWRECPNCHNSSRVTITAYPDIEYWSCPRCKAHIEFIPDNGKYGSKISLNKIQKQDNKDVTDFKRNVKRKYLTGKKRKELGLDE